MGGVAGALKTPFALIVPSVELPPSIGSPPTGPTDQTIVLVTPPVSLAVKVAVLAVPDVVGVGQLGIGDVDVELLVQVVELTFQVMLTTGAGVMVTVDEADNCGS